MRSVVVAILVMLVGCAEKKPPPPTPTNELEAFERKYVAYYQQVADRMRKEHTTVGTTPPPTGYRAVFVGPSGVFIDRKLVATLDTLTSTPSGKLQAQISENARQLRTDGRPLAALVLDEQPAERALAAIKLFAGTETEFIAPSDTPDAEGHPFRSVGKVRIALQRSAPSTIEADGGSKAVRLSLLLDKDVAWVGVSVLDELQEIPNRANERDWSEIEKVLAQHKESAFFGDRTELELAVVAGTGGDVVRAMKIASDVGFVDLDVLPADQLSARPNL